MGKFASDVADWVNRTEQAKVDTVHQAVRLLVKQVTKPESQGGHMPVVTGNLRNSVAVSADGPVTVDWKTKKFRDPTDAVNNAIAAIEIGKKAYVGFRAPYAHKIEQNEGFARLAAQMWPQIVDEAAKTVKKR